MPRFGRKDLRSRQGDSSLNKSAGGDNELNLDEQLFVVLEKEYDDGESGKKEAIQDVKTVLKEVSKEPVVQAINKLIPHFLSAPCHSGDSTEDSNRARSVSRGRTAPPRFKKLTARPSPRHGPFQHTEETVSTPHLPPPGSAGIDQDAMRTTFSAPMLPRSASGYTSPASTYASDVPSSAESRKTRDGTMTASTIASSPVRLTKPPKNSVMSSSETMDEEEDEEEEEEDEKEKVPFTENLLQVPKDTSDTEEILWKSDIVELTKMKSTPKGKAGGTDVLELKYKEPIWPHQLHLNQILGRLPRLTHLILDGSELRFLRDLGSSLQSLITLSICDCGLRSLDGAYAMPNLRTLIARKNAIKIPTQCSFLSRLSYLDLSSNPISTFDEFGSLRLCGELRILKLHDTPVATMPDFNKEMKRLVPQLKEIHPPSLETLNFKHIRQQGQNQMREESNQVETMEKNSVPSLSYNQVVQDEPKAGIAYQKIRDQTVDMKKQQEEQKKDGFENANLGGGDFTGIFMAPNFLKRLGEAMPPSSAEDDGEEDELDDNHININQTFGEDKPNMYQ